MSEVSFALQILSDRIKIADCLSMHDCDVALSFENTGPLSVCKIIVTAFNGSLDSALQFHELLIPGFDWNLGPDTAAVWSNEGDEPFSFSATHEKPARAWLMAIIEAFVALDEGGKHE